METKVNIVKEYKQHDPPVDPDKDDDDETEEDDDFPTREDLSEEDFDLNHDPDDDLSLNIDDEELN